MPQPDDAPGPPQALFPKGFIVLAAVFLLALVPRFIGLSWGFPYQFHPDESSPVYQAVQAGQGRLNPSNFYKPTLWPYSLTACYGLYFLLGRAFGAFSSLAHFQFLYIVETWRFWWIARALAASLSALTVCLIFCAGKALGRPWAGLLGAGLLAISVRHVAQSHIATADAAVTFLCTASLFSAIAMIRRGRDRDALFTGLLLGLAVATKYNAAVFIPCIVFAHAARVRQEGKPLRAIFDRRAGIAAAAAAAAFLVACPWVVLDARTFFADALANVRFARTGWYGGATRGYGWLYYINNTLARGEGWPVVLAWIAGATAVFVRRRPCEMLVAVWGVLYFAVVGSAQLVAHRYLMPALPAIFLAAAFSAEDVARWLAARRGSLRIGHAGVVVLILLLVITPGANTLLFLRLYKDKDFRSAAAGELEGVIPPEARVLSDYWCFSAPLADMPSDPEDVQAGVDDRDPGSYSAEAQLDNWLNTRQEQGLGDLNSLGLERPQFPARYRIKFIDYPWSGKSEAKIQDFEFYRSHGFRYVILADTLMNVARKRRDDKGLAPYATFLDALEASAVKRMTFRNPDVSTARWLGLEIPGRIDLYVIDEKARQ